jgi:hypothetical protein
MPCPWLEGVEPSIALRGLTGTELPDPRHCSGVCSRPFTPPVRALTRGSRGLEAPSCRLSPKAGFPAPLWVIEYGVRTAEPWANDH